MLKLLLIGIVVSLTGCTTALPAKRLTATQLNPLADALVAINMDTKLSDVVVELKCVAQCSADVHLKPFAKGRSKFQLEV